MTDPQSRVFIQRERMRLGQVRKSFAAGIEQQVGGAAVPLEFFATCVDYIKAAMDRLHDQDQRIHDMLKPHVTATDTEGHEVLANLNMRLAKSRVALAQLVAARDAYRAKGNAGWADFKAAIDAFMDVYFNILMKGHHSTTTMQEKHFTDRHWDEVAGITQDSRIGEASLFAAVKRLAPSGADPESFKAGPPAK